MSEAEMLKLRVDAVVEAFAVLDELRSYYEQAVSLIREHVVSDVQKPLAITAEIPPKPLHIKEEKEKLWTSLEGEQLNVLEAADITKFLVTTTVTSEDDNNREAEPPVVRSATPIITVLGEEGCDESQPARNLRPHCHSHPNADGKASESSETEVINGVWQEALLDSGPGSKDRDSIWKETRALESAVHAIKYKEALVSHVECNSKKKSFSFFNCSKRFSYKGILQRHMMCHFGKMFSSCFVGKKCPRVLTKKPLDCDVCGEKFIQKCDMKNYIRIHTGGKLFGCAVCGKRFTEKGRLTRHLRIHTGEKPFGCYVCGKRFSQKYEVKCHMRGHTDKKQFSCDVCGKICTKSGNLKIHMRTHTGEKPFECDVCGKRFTAQGNLKTHMRIHTGEEPFSCDVCGRRFTVQSSLTSHRRIHTGEKPFGCDLCEKRYKNKLNLKTHMHIHTGEKLFDCDLCKKRFTNQRSLKRHMHAHT